MSHKLGYTVRKFFPQVRIVKNAKQPITIEVTKEDVTNSKRKAHKGCAMAVACKRKLKLDGVLIARTVAYLIKGTTAIRFDVPPSVEREVTSFDRGAEFAPGIYQLSKGSKTSGPKKTKSTVTTTAHGRGALHHVTTGIREVLGGKDAQL